ncbi:DUF255 domain-containing protein [Jiella pelagia]|uniref:DUF255 domain-containing protein n=1 Tax=Jiella pelagia TaxID=2986949 RepID=A0ABY7C9Y1_9HYPH|nr:DUF255 domain-containing protein [Jiella pelagia]WAP70595.1 DUF255 domain-containing protein [Jiella pelagia]
MSNQLGDAVSPYLLQHEHNPVDWRQWSPQALDEAKARDCPILLSVGYAACHWCHVMAHESFEDAAVAGVMNELFVNVKVDREERPDIDHLYMSALHAMGEQGGWPMTMFLTPDGWPFFGGTYFPKEPRYGRPGFVQVMEAIAKAWAERREDIEKSAGTIAGHLQSVIGGTLEAGAQSSGALATLDLAGAAARIGGLIDPARGGMKGAPKFPNAPFMEVIARSAFETGEEAHLDAFLRTTRALAEGGIYDHLGGGLHRYSTDDRWLVPHFEKMLYDNAQFLRHLCWAFRATGDEALPPADRRDRRLAGPRDAARGGRSCRLARCRQPGPARPCGGGSLLCLGRSGGGRASRRGGGRSQARLRRHGGRQLGGQGDPASPASGRPQRRSGLRRGAGEASGSARKPLPAGPRRQGAGRLERPRHPGPVRGRANPRRWPRPRDGEGRLCLRDGRNGRGRPAPPCRARRADGGAGAVVRLWRADVGGRGALCRNPRKRPPRSRPVARR